MCVILDIGVQKAIPEDMLELACKINPDGFGLAYIEKGSIRIERSISQNDPKEVSKLLHQLRNHRRILHLRYSTVGEVTLENNHPFVVLGNRRGNRLVMFHNGTLYSYANHKSTLSDTYQFNEQFLKPLSERIESHTTTKGLLVDNFFRHMVAKEVGLNVIVLFDKFGRTVRYNEGKGKSYEGFWASNEYSFDKHHSRNRDNYNTVHTINRVSDYNGQPFGWNGDLPWEEVAPSVDQDAVLAWEAKAIEERRNIIQGGVVTATPDMMLAVTNRVERFKKIRMFIDQKRDERRRAL